MLLINKFKFHYDLNFYFNAQNIPNQDLVFETYNYFEKQDGKRFFVALDFLNLLYWNYKFLNDNIDKPFDIINHLRLLPLSKIENHLLIAFILKWFGGYPINNLNSQYNTTLRLVEDLYLGNIGLVNKPLLKDIVDFEIKGFKNYRNIVNELDTIVKDNSKKERLKEISNLLNNKLTDSDEREIIEVSKKINIFLSHSSKDEKIVKEFNDKILQLVLKVNPDNIFCTSIEESSITSGEDFRLTIKNKLLEASHIIQIITNNYKNSEVCLNEMGAAWVLDKKVKPFILEPISYNTVGFIHNTNQQLKLTEEKDLIKFIDEMLPDLSISQEYSIINRHIKEFVDFVNEQKDSNANTTLPINDIQNQPNSELVFFDLNKTKDYYVKGLEENNYEDGKPIGNKSKAEVKVQNNIITVTRLNTDGRFVISFLRFTNSNGVNEYIESNIFNLPTRIICFEFEAKTVGGKHSLLLAAKKINTNEWIHGANKRIEVNSSTWVKLKHCIVVPSEENFSVFIDIREVAKAPSMIYIKDLVIKEVF